MSEPAQPTDSAPKRVHHARVKLPEGARRPFEVFINGVAQHEGTDYDVRAEALLFYPAIRREGKLGLFRWIGITLGVIGSYRQNDSVDLIFNRGGKRVVETRLPIEVLAEPDDLAAHRPGGYSPH